MTESLLCISDSLNKNQCDQISGGSTNKRSDTVVSEPHFRLTTTFLNMGRFPLTVARLGSSLCTKLLEPEERPLTQRSYTDPFSLGSCFRIVSVFDILTFPHVFITLSFGINVATLPPPPSLRSICSYW